MEICWDNLDGIRLTRNGVFLKNNRHSFIYMDLCKICGDPYLTLKHKPSEFCGRSCALSGEGHPGYGKPLSNDHKQKLSISFTGEKNHFYGKHHSDEIKNIIKGKATGRKHSYVTRKKFSKARRGKPIHSEEEKRRRSELLKGSNNPQWKGGISKLPYCTNWTKEYKEEIKERDGYQCLNPYCFGRAKRLHVHHIDYTKTLCGPDNLITVCNSCNSRANKDREWHIAWYRTILSNRYSYNYKTKEV